VINPTRVARTSEVEARITVAQRFPASREMVENRAEAKARARPTRDSRNLTQTSALADCSHRASRLGKVELESNGLVRAEPTGRSLAFRMGTHNREALAEKAFVTWLGRCRGWRRGQKALRAGRVMAFRSLSSCARLLPSQRSGGSRGFSVSEPGGG